MQEIFTVVSRCTANTVPTVSAIGNAGGTAIVSKSRPLIMISLVLTPACV